jgi:hypothetical protein
MIVGERFVWAHIPKTAGDATATMIATAPRLVILADHLRDNAKHLAFSERRGSIEGKLLVANTRRLPSWALSLARHEEKFGAFPDYEPTGPQPPDVIAARSAADDLLDLIVGEFEVDRWIRQEHLADDLVGFLREVAELTADEEAAIRSVGRVNDQRSRLQWRSTRPAESFFSPAQIETLYRNNPRWAAVERHVYGRAGSEPPRGNWLRRARRQLLRAP